MDPLVIRTDLVIPPGELAFAAVRAAGPGGQNVNKVASKVELRFDLAHTVALGPAVCERLRFLARNRLDADGRVLVVSQKTRDQIRNLEDAREKLRALVLAALEVPTVRRATKPTRSSQRRRVADKRVQGDRKRDRRSGGNDGD